MPTHNSSHSRKFGEPLTRTLPMDTSERKKHRRFAALYAAGIAACTQNRRVIYFDRFASPRNQRTAQERKWSTASGEAALRLAASSRRCLLLEQSKRIEKPARIPKRTGHRPESKIFT